MFQNCFINLNEAKVISIINEDKVTIYFSETFSFTLDFESIEDKKNFEKILEKGTQRWFKINNKGEK